MEFRNQVIHIWTQSIGYSEEPFVRHQIPYYDEDAQAVQQIHLVYGLIHKKLCEEYGVLALPGSEHATGPCQALRLFLQRARTDEALDAIELTFQMMSTAQQRLYAGGFFQPSLNTSEAIEKLNFRFKEHAIGYRLEQGKIVRIDSEFLNAEAVEPALQLMYAKGYEGALQEFQMAQKYYRQGSDYYDDCLTNCLKALESTLQKIIELRNWEIPGAPKFDNLFAEVRNKGLFPSILSSHLGELKKFLQAVAVIRNEEGAHGSGSMPNEVPEHLVAYQIHLTGSAIVFLIRCNENFGKTKS